jgi:1,4-alpha-glucan branching enzyme
VRAFLVSSALFWLDAYHLDGLRVDAVASMLYLDYAPEGWRVAAQRARRQGEPRRDRVPAPVNESVYASTRRADDRRGIDRVADGLAPDHSGGLGFGMKWNMGWMHDTLEYFGRSPCTASTTTTAHVRIWYAFIENFVLPLSHDEVVYGKRSLIGKMPGDDWQQFANLRRCTATCGHIRARSCLFMGGEFAQGASGRTTRSSSGRCSARARTRRASAGVSDVNRVYRETPALHEMDFEMFGFEWVVGDDRDASVVVFLRRARRGSPVLVACNFTPVPRADYVVGVPEPGYWREC